MISKNKERLQITIPSTTVEKLKTICHEYYDDMTISQLTERLYNALLKGIESETEEG